MIRGRIRRMENLISGILEISKVGRSNKKKELVVVKELLDEIIESIAPPPGFRIEIAKNMPVILAERVLLQQVFTNLLSNAIKHNHSPAGHIWISYRKTDMHEFTIKDDGPGIDPAYHTKIFEMFQTLTEQDAFESTGIGLSLVKKIVEDKGGSVTVESAPGQGAAFTFTWPDNLLE
jgi:signal transduction histidine kinase